MRSVKNNQRLLFLDDLPVRIGLGEMPPKSRLAVRVVNQKRQVRCKRGIVNCRDEYRKRVRTHERQSRRAIFDPVEFWNVHSASLSRGPTSARNQVYLRLLG